MPNSAIHRVNVLCSVLWYKLCYLHVVPIAPWGSNSCPPRPHAGVPLCQKKGKRELPVLKKPFLGEGQEKCQLFCPAVETMGSLLTAEKLCCEFCFSDRQISVCIENSPSCQAVVLPAVEQIFIVLSVFPHIKVRGEGGGPRRLSHLYSCLVLLMKYCCWTLPCLSCYFFFFAMVTF